MKENNIKNPTYDVLNSEKGIIFFIIIYLKTNLAFWMLLRLINLDDYLLHLHTGSLPLLLWKSSLHGR